MAVRLILERDSGQPYVGRANTAITLVAAMIIVVMPCLSPLQPAVDYLTSFEPLHQGMPRNWNWGRIWWNNTLKKKRDLCSTLGTSNKPYS